MAETTVQPIAQHTTDAMAEFAGYLDVPMQIALEVGRRILKVREILTLQPGSIVELPRAAGENLDLYINERLVAFGEILETDGKAGIRLTGFVQQS